MSEFMVVLLVRSDRETAGKNAISHFHKSTRKSTAAVRNYAGVWAGLSGTLWWWVGVSDHPTSHQAFPYFQVC